MHPKVIIDDLKRAGDQLVAYLAQQAQAPRGRAHPTGAARARLGSRRLGRRSREDRPMREGPARRCVPATRAMSGPALVEENGKVAPSTKTDMASYGSRSAQRSLS